MRYISTLIVSVALAAIVQAGAPMTFKVEGTTPTGGTYAGKVTVTELPSGSGASGQIFDVVWEIGGDMTRGVGIVDDKDNKTLAVSFVSNGQPGVSIIKETEKGAEGIWYLKDQSALGSERWLAEKAGDTAAQGGPADKPAEGAITYDRAVECAAATSFMTGTLRSSGGDAGKIKAYDQANSLWLGKLSEISQDMDKNITAIQAKQQELSAGDLAIATRLADDCVAKAPPL